ncbi:MAG: 2Fe-2S iron-sulfur cluster binding domain-containing protein [Proteobacteria bacterium]|nr:2Fe-2S iron-sulfur cluster binding domain-containing protein [Pseudomonadota bacterium]
MLFDSRPKLEVCVAQTGERYPCATDESLLRGMLKLGRRGIPAGCVNGGCGVCKVRIAEGTVTRLGPVSRAHVSSDDECRGITLACRVAPATPVRLEVVGKLVKPFSASISKGPAMSAVHEPTLQTTQHEGDR